MLTLPPLVTPLLALALALPVTLTLIVTRTLTLPPTPITNPDTYPCDTNTGTCTRAVAQTHRGNHMASYDTSHLLRTIDDEGHHAG